MRRKAQAVTGPYQFCYSAGQQFGGSCSPGLEDIHDYTPNPTRESLSCPLSLVGMYEVCVGEYDILMHPRSHS